MESLTVGVEEELAVVDGRHRTLVPRASEVIARLPEGLREFVDHELKSCQIETATPVCADLTELEHHLTSLRAGVAGTARRIGCEILAGGTHPSSSWADQTLTAKPSYQELEGDYQRLTDEQVLFGCHVHVGVPDPDLRIAAMDRVRRWLSPLLALTANSPYWEAADTGYASYRYVLFSRWPTFLTPGRLCNWAAYEELVDTFVAGGVIDSPKRLYWTVRPSGQYPTIEFRIADVCRSVPEALMVAGLCRALVMTAVEEEKAGIEPADIRSESFRVAEWQAARYGLGQDLLDPADGTSRPAAVAVAQLLEHVDAALRATGDHEIVHAVVDDLIANGNGADRQRRSMAQGRGVAGLLRSLEAAPVAGLSGPPVIDLAS